MLKYKAQLFIFTVLFLFIGMALTSNVSTSRAASLKVSYLGKTRNYKGAKINAYVNNKSVTKGKPKGLVINKTTMVSYKDVFAKGTGASCTYTSSSKKITIKQNGVTITMWVGKKTAKVNGTKLKMPTAPVRVKYIKSKKSSILVPAKFVSTNLKFKYSWNKTSKKLNLTSPLKISYDKNLIYYNNYRGNLRYNNKDYKLTTMPAMLIDKATYVPAQEVFQQRMGMEYSFDSKTNMITIRDPETGKSVIYTIDKNTAIVDGNNINMTYPPRLITRHDTNKTIVCVPVNYTTTKLGYYYAWNKAKSLSEIHKKSYFNWQQLMEPSDPTATDDPSATDIPSETAEPSPSSEPTNEPVKNKITSLSANYDNKKESIVFEVKGESAEIMNAITLSRTAGVLVISIPTTEYQLMDNEYTLFGDILSSFKAEQKDDITLLTLVSEKGGTLDYAYSVTDNVFTLLVMDEYVGKYSLKIDKPLGVTFNMVTNTDYYRSNKFVITLKGNHIKYFSENPVAISNDVIKSIDVSLNASKNTLITVKTKKLQGYKIYNKSESFVVNVDSPRKIYSKIVVLDAGHGGHDPGAVGNKTKEKDLNFKMIYTLMKTHFSSNAPEIKAYWTRSKDEFITLSNRAAYAKKMGADIFVSLHMNSWSKSSINGTEVYYSASNNKKAFSGLTSKKMASLFLKRLVPTMGTKNRGVSAQKYTVVHKNTVPAVLIELGFISGSSDFKKISNTTYQKKATKTIYDTINEIFNTYSTKR